MLLPSCFLLYFFLPVNVEVSHKEGIVNEMFKTGKVLFLFAHENKIFIQSYGAFTLLDTHTDKVSNFHNITAHSYGTQIKIGNKIGIGSVSVKRPLKILLMLEQ